MLFRSPEPEPEPEPVPEPLRRPQRPETVAPARRRPSEKPKALDDMFMDDDDDYDAFEEAMERSERRRQRSYGSRYEDEDDDDDDEEESFFFRHLRAIVGIVLLLALIGGLAFYVMTDPGQAMLARVDLPLPFIKAEKIGRAHV